MKGNFGRVYFSLKETLKRSIALSLIITFVTSSCPIPSSYAAGTVTIDAAWLAANGPGPYYLNQTATTYILDTDVSTKGTAFVIIAKDIVFDLNGHTITYDNAPKMDILNGSFENGAENWNLATAPNASLFAGTYLWNEVYDGAYSLKFSLPAADSSVSSVQTVTLEPNTTYSLSAMFEFGGKGSAVNPGVKGYVRLVAEGLPMREVFWNATNWRGIQLREGVFTTGPASETYAVTVGIETPLDASGNPIAVAPTNYFIDDIKIQRTKVYGVTPGAQTWAAADYPGVTQYGLGTNAVIKNGVLVQGVGGATWAHGVYSRSVNNVTMSGLNITVHGANSSAIYQNDPGTMTFIVSGNTLTSNVRTISSRDNFHGTVIYGTQGQIYNNTITNGPHAGIKAAGGIASDIHHNVIKLKAKYTNAFAILAHKGSQIHDNTVDCGEGEFACRGIGSSGDPDPAVLTRIFGNTVKVQQHINNQEYEGAMIGGAYGIQLENAKNVEVYNNDVYAYGNAVPAYAFRMNSDGGTTGYVSAHDNIFRAIFNSAHAASLKFSNIPDGLVDFHDNTLITNDGIVGETSSSYVTLKRTHLVVNQPVGNAFPLESDWWPDATQFHTLISFVDTVFEASDTLTEAEVRAYLENAIFRNARRYNNALGTPDNRCAFSLAWTTTIQVQDQNSAPVAGAAVSVTDFLDQLVFSGVTDAEGKGVAVIKQLQTQGATKTNYNDHEATATYGGEMAQKIFTADKIQSVVLALGGVVDTTPPALSSITSSGITTSSAQITWTTDELSDSWVEYGTSTAYGTISADAGMTTTHNMPLNGLSSSTLYHYRVKSKDASGNMAASGDFTFTTLTPVVAPSITSQPVSQTVTVGQMAAFSVTASGTAPLSYQWQKNSVDISGATSASYTTPATLASDNGSTFRCVVSNVAGTATSNSATLTVNSVTDTTPPVISTVSVSTTKSTAMITWTTNEPSTSQVEYGLTTGYGSVSALDTNLVTSHSVTLTGLTAAKTYYFRVKSKDSSNNLAVSANAKLRTKRK